RERGDGAAHFTQQINEAVVARELQVARPAAGFQLQERRRICRELPALLVEQELKYLVGPEMRHEDEAIRAVDMNRVRVARRWNDLQRLADAALGAHRIDA